MAQNVFGHLIPGQQQPVAPSQADPILAPPDPYKQSAESRAWQDQAFQANSDARAAEAAAVARERARRDKLEWDATHNPDGTPKVQEKPKELATITPAAASGIQENLKTLRGIESALAELDMRPGSIGPGTGFFGDTFTQFNDPAGTEARAAVGKVGAFTIHDLSGAAVSASEAPRFTPFVPTVTDRPEVARRKLEQFRDELRAQVSEQIAFFSEANGYRPYSSPEIDRFRGGNGPTGQGDQREPIPAAGSDAGAPPAPGIDPRGNGNIPGAGGGSTEQLRQGNTKSVAIAGVEQRYRQLLASGASGDDLVAYLQSAGINDHQVLTQAKVQANYRQRFPNVPISDYSVSFTRDVPLTAADRAMDAASQSSIGTFVARAGNTISGNNFDSIAGVTGGNAERTRQGLDIISQQNPLPSALGDIFGGMVSGIGAEAGLARMGVANGLARTTGANALVGAVGGAGATDTNALAQPASVGDRAVGALTGAGVNALAGLAASGVMRAGEAVVNPAAGVVRRAMGRDQNVAVNQVARSLREDGLTPRQAAERISAARERGVPMSISDTGENSRELLASVARARGPARSITKEVVGDRQKEQLERLSGAVRRDLGPTANIRELGDELMMRAKDESAPLYQEAFAAQGADAAFPKVKNLLARPSMQKAMARARRIAAEEGRNPDELGLVMDDAGRVSFFEYPQNLAANLQKARNDLMAAQRRSSGSMMGSNSKEIAAAEDAVRNAEAALANAPRGPMVTRTPSWETLHYIKTGLDDVIEQYRDKTTGKLVLDAEGRLINNTKNQLLKVMDAGNPAYKEARGLYAGPASMKDAMELGYGALNRSPDDVAANIKDLGPSEMEMYRLGLRKAIVDKMEGKGDYADKVRLMNNTPKTRAVLSKVLGGKAEFDRFMATLADEAELAKTYAAVTGNSTTAGRTAFDATTQNESIAGGLLDIGKVYASQGKMGVVERGFDKVVEAGRLGPGQAGDKARAQIAELLSTSDPEQLMEIARQAQRAAAKARLGSRKANARAVRAGSIGSAIGALGGQETSGGQ